MGKRLSIIILVILAVSAAGLGSVILTRGKAEKIQNKPPSYAPPVAQASASQETTVGSPDGKLSLTMKQVKGKEDVTYVFFVTNSTDDSQKEIFRKTSPVGTTMSIPGNTFSPDDKYVFLKESNSLGTRYLVLSVSGTPLTKDGSTLEISSLFAAKYPDLKITDVTGWGGVNLIIFNTDKAEGGTGPSFWFEVPSGGFIQLSNRFN